MKYCVFLLMFLAVAAPGAALAAHTNATAYLSGIEYEPVITGIEDQDLVELLQAEADSFTLKDRPPPTIRQLRKRAEGDLEDMRKALDARGYFQASVDLEIHDETAPVEIRFRIAPGPRFTFGAIRILNADTNATLSFPQEPIEQQGVVQAAPYDSESVVKAQQSLLRHLSSVGHPYPSIEHRRVVADHLTQTVAVTWKVSPGPEADFGPLDITGLHTIDPEYVRSLLPWEEGDVYDVSLISRARNDLARSELFSAIDIRKGQVVRGAVPISIKVTERLQRTIGVGLGFNTDEGPYALLAWKHRNILGGGETLDISAKASSLIRSLETGLTEPLFWRADQNLRLTGAIEDEDTDAFSSRRIRVASVVERELSPKFTVGAGIRFGFSRVEDQESTDTFGMLSLPLLARLDYTDSLLDPSQGGRLGLEIAPSSNVLGIDATFLKARATYSHYFELLQEKRLILALRGSAGLIYGATRDSIPADELFYAGGGGSVRGYPFQEAGELDDDDEPVGGLSLLEASCELRYRIYDNFGVVGFLDAGRAFAERTPGSDPLFYGAGLGARYYSAIGPIRLDVAFPLNKRDDVDDAFQLYISVGHSF